MKRQPEVKTPNWVLIVMNGNKPAYIYVHVVKIGVKFHAKIVGRETPPIVGYTEQSIEQQLRQIIETTSTK